MPVLSVTFIRHGESTDNLGHIWAGWKDAPLSDYGMNQALAMGTSLSTTPFIAIHASPLLRAHSTAQVLQTAQPHAPPLTTSLLLREQYFGDAEAKPWTPHPTPGWTLEDHFARGVYPVLPGRDDRFPNGESLTDLEARAGQVIREIILPYVWRMLKNGKAREEGVHIALVSHKALLSELTAALLRLDDEVKRDGTEVHAKTYKELLNAAWTQVAVDCPAAEVGVPFEFDETDPPPLRIKVETFNQHEHLDTVKR